MSDFKPFVPEETDQPEFTFRAVFLGVIMAVVLGAANAYLGLKAGMTVAATFPAAVVSMAVLKMFRGSILEENMSRTIASVGEALVAGAIFTLPAFYMSGVWKKFGGIDHYLESTAIMLVGGVIGVLFVTILRRIMIVESDLPFPESIAAAEIHKAGRTGGTGAKYLFGSMIVGGLIQLGAKMNLFMSSWEKFIPFKGSSVINFSSKDGNSIGKITGGGGMMVATPAVSPAYVGVGYIIGPKLSAIAFSGGVLAWALFVPLLSFLLGNSHIKPMIGKQIAQTAVVKTEMKFTNELNAKKLPEAMVKALGDKKYSMAYSQVASRWIITIDGKSDLYYIQTTAFPKQGKDGKALRTKDGKVIKENKLVLYKRKNASWASLTGDLWKLIVRPIAVGGMLIGAIFTLYSMRKELFGGIARALGDIKKAATQEGSSERLDKDLNFKWIFLSVGIGLIFMAALYYYYCQSIVGAVVSTVIMGIAGFFFSAVAGYLVGLIGSSNNPISGLTLSTLIISALLMVAVGVKGTLGISAVLGVAAVVCCMCGVAGDMLQDLKVGRILGGTPWKMELGEIIGVIAAALVMFLPLLVLHQGNINAGGEGFGDKLLPAPQAGLMSMLAKGIIGGEMAWPLIIVGMFMAIGLIMVGSPSPMLIAVGMYLPLETTFTIFVGGMVKWILDIIMNKKKLEEGKRTIVDNTGVLLASGFIAGEALTGLLIAGLSFAKISVPEVLTSPSIFVGMGVLGAYSASMIFIPLRRANAEG